MKTALKFADQLSSIERMLTEHEVAEILNVKVSTLRAWRTKGSPLPFCKLNKRSVRYSPQAVRDYLEASTFTSTTEADHTAR